MCRRSIRPSFTGWASLFLSLFIFLLKFLSRMLSVRRKRGDQQGISLATQTQHNQKILILKPQEKSRIVPPFVIPCLYARIMGMIDYRPYPPDTLTAT